MNLSKCNQRIKILAIFERLTYYGLLDNQTLMVVETPEDKLITAGLQELSELIFELNEELGVRFLLGTDNPKLITTLQTLSKTHRKEENMNIYYAREEETNKYTFIPG